MPRYLGPSLMAMNSSKVASKKVQRESFALKCHQKKSPDVCYVVVENVAATLGEMCLNFHDRKAENLCIVGTTGTNGKTSVSTLLFDLLLFVAIGADWYQRLKTASNKPSSQVRTPPLI